MSRLAPSVAITGGGIVGLSLAWRLAQRGLRVSVLEKGAMGGEASWAGAGMLAPGGEVEGPSELAAQAVESRNLYGAYVRDLQHDSGLAIDFQETGALDLAYSAPEWQALEARAAAQAPLGIRSQVIDRADVSACWPRIRTDGLEGARFYPDDALVNPREVVLALCACCKKLGVALVQNCAVEEILFTSEAAVIRTAQFEAAFDSVVIAAGAWSSSIRIGGAALPAAEPVKGHLIGYQQPGQTSRTIIRHGPSYLMQRATGLLIAGASVEHLGFDRTIDFGIAAGLAASAAFVLPHLKGITPTEIWNGLRPASDALHTGRWQLERLFLAYGHYRNGILLAPLTAQKLAAEISASLQTR